ncbi:hypothetical protein GCM10023149_39760 [Mucilaginibacter gynuensis]|uniref:Polysaccharide export outer membrane protein n=1 Tax=Mucilaginibacter gynuensis TaxID=1302236 RepID=A0ABP8H2L2_9SPHI
MPIKKQFLTLLCLISMATVLFSSCSYKQNQVLFENPVGAAPVSNTGYEAPIYKIKPQDILQVRNLQNIKYIVEDVSSAATPSGGGSSSSANAQGQAYQVEEDGTVALPVIGRIPVAGLSRLEAAKKIEASYKEKLLKDPIIEVKIVNLKVTLFGEIKVPGNYPLIKDKTTLVDIIGEAGGLTDKANEKTIKIIRGGTSNPQTTVINLSDINSLTNPAIVLQNQDIVYVAQNKRAIRSEKLQNFSLIAQPALLLLNTALIILTLAK